MGDMFAPLGEYIKDNGMQLHQGMAIENIVLFYAYAFTLATIIGAVLLIMVARRIRPGRLDDEAIAEVSPGGGSGAEEVDSGAASIPAPMAAPGAATESSEPLAHSAPAAHEPTPQMQTQAVVPEQVESQMGAVIGDEPATDVPWADMPAAEPIPNDPADPQEKERE